MTYSVEIDGFKGDYATCSEAIDGASAYIKANNLSYTTFPVYRSSGGWLSASVLYTWAHI